jgi:hypothetical protein
MNNMQNRMGPSNGPMLAEQQNTGMSLLAEAINFGAIGIQQQGYSTNALNVNETYNLQQPGNMGNLVGIAIFNVGAPAAIQAQTFDLTINSNQAISNIPVLAVCPQQLENGYGNNSMPFFPIYRKLMGNDQIQLTIRSTAAVTLITVLYFMP